MAADPANPANENRDPEAQTAEPNPMRRLDLMFAVSDIPEAIQSSSGAEPFLEHYRRVAQGENLMAERDDIREEIKDKLAAAEARTEVKITALNGKLDQVLTKIDGMNSRFGEIRTDVGQRMSEIRDDVKDDGRATRANYWLGVFAIIGAMVAIAVGFPVVVDYGMKLGEMKHAQEAPKTPATKTP